MAPWSQFNSLLPAILRYSYLHIIYTPEPITKANLVALRLLTVKDEMKALQRINSISLLFGYLGFLATWILEAIYTFTRKSGVHTADVITSHILRIISPHFNLARQGFFTAPKMSPRVS